MSTWTTIALVSGTLGTWASGGFVADGALAGAYELQIPDAICASGARWVAIRLYGAANMLPCLIEIEIDAVNYQDAVKFGLSAVPSNTVQVNGVAVSTADGTAQAGAATSITLATADPAGANAYVDRILTLVGGTGAGQSRYITAYNSTTKVATVQRAWDTAPDATTQYAINDTAATSAVTGGDTAGTTTLLSRLPAALSFTGANVNANAQAVVDKAGYTVSTVQDKTGYSGTATNFTAAPTPAQIAAAILSVPANLLTTDGAGRVGANNLPTDYQQRAIAVTLPAAPTGYGGASAAQVAAGILLTPANLLATDGTGRVTVGTNADKAGYTASASNLPADYLSAGEIAKLNNLDVAVSTRMATFTPATAPTVAQIAAALLSAPANLLMTDGSGRVTLVPGQSTVASNMVPDLTTALAAVKSDTSSLVTSMGGLVAAITTSIRNVLRPGGGI